MNEVLLNLLLIAAGLVALYFGAEWLVKGSVDVALVFGITPLLIGLTVVAFGTSAPELCVGVALNLGGHPDIAVGNVVGSNICNIALMLGIAALIRPIDVKPQLFRRDLPVLLGASVVFVAMLWDQKLLRWEGMVLMLILVVYVVVSFRIARTTKDPEIRKEFEEELHTEEKPRGRKGILIGLALIVIGVLVLVGGAESLKRGAVFLAHRYGVSDAIIGLTLVAVGTSLPEIATSIVATLRRHGDIVTGNAIGSCTFNIGAVMGLVAIIKPVIGSGALQQVDLFVMLGLTILIIPVMWSRNRIGRIEGAFLLSIYLGYCWYLAQRGTV